MTVLSRESVSRLGYHEYVMLDRLDEAYLVRPKHNLVVSVVLG